MDAERGIPAGTRCLGTRVQPVRALIEAHTQVGLTEDQLEERMQTSQSFVASQENRANLEACRCGDWDAVED